MSRLKKNIDKAMLGEVDETLAILINQNRELKSENESLEAKLNNLKLSYDNVKKLLEKQKPCRPGIIKVVFKDWTLREFETDDVESALDWASSFISNDYHPGSGNFAIYNGEGGVVIDPAEVRYLEGRIHPVQDDVEEEGL